MGNPEKLMVSVDGKPAISFVEFCEVNEFEFNERVDMLVDLQVSGQTVYGGGAVPEFTIRKVEA